ncbi:MAG TPA: hypothetical protein VHL59_11570 [Thermoanaerobaculia bacterium]|nr:hypothetical protein [Thermoanaerobaculia bacterium]
MSATCRYEAGVLRAAEEDRWTDGLREHLRDCDDCMAAASVAPWLDRFARMSDRQHILPDPSIVWLKARLLQGTIDVARVSRPMTVLQLVAYLVVAGGWAALLMGKWSAIEAWFRGFTPTGLVVSAARAEALSMSFLAIVFVLATTTVMLALHTILAEE